MNTKISAYSTVFFCTICLLILGLKQQAKAANNEVLLIEIHQCSEEFQTINSEGEWNEKKAKKYFKFGNKFFRNPFYKESGTNQKRISSIVVLILTGPLGGHRLYLGTSPVVPVVYAVTLGGGMGVLPIIDLGVLTFSNDISPYIDNDKVIMWIK